MPFIKDFKQISGHNRLTIPKGTYDFMTEDIEIVTAYAISMGNIEQRIVQP